MRSRSLTRFASAAYAALAVADSLLAGSTSPTRRKLRLVTKPLLMPALGTAFAGSLLDLPGDGPRGRGGLLRGGTVAAQALSGVGDIALLRRTEPAFLAGLSSFFGAHVAYTAAFVSAGRSAGERRDLTGPATALAVFAATGPVLGAAAGQRSSRLRTPVTAYAGVISTMYAASTRLGDQVPDHARRKVVAGACLFAASDTLIGVRQFVLDDAPPWTDAVVMASYTAGQGLIAAGVAQAVRARSASAPKHRA